MKHLAVEQGIALTPLALGPAVVTNGTKGVVQRLYNGDYCGLFQADNGPVFTTNSTDLELNQPPLTADQIIAELNRIFRAPLRADLQCS